MKIPGLAEHCLRIADGDPVLAFIFFHVCDGPDMHPMVEPFPTRAEMDAMGEPSYTNGGKWWRYDINSGYDWYFGWNAKGELSKATCGDHDFVEGAPEYDEAAWQRLMDFEKEVEEDHAREGTQRSIVYYDRMAFDRDNLCREGKRFYRDTYWSEKPLNIDDWLPIELWRADEDDPAVVSATAAWRAEREKRRGY